MPDPYYSISAKAVPFIYRIAVTGAGTPDPDLTTLLENYLQNPGGTEKPLRMDDVRGILSGLPPTQHHTPKAAIQAAISRVWDALYTTYRADDPKTGAPGGYLIDLPTIGDSVYHTVGSGHEGALLFYRAISAEQTTLWPVDSAIFDGKYTFSAYVAIRVIVEVVP